MDTESAKVNVVEIVDRDMLADWLITVHNIVVVCRLNALSWCLNPFHVIYIYGHVCIISMAMADEDSTEKEAYRKVG